MNDKNDNHLNMQPNKDNNDYYIMQLNELINESNNDILIMDKRPVKIMNMQQKQRGCWDWFLSKITFWKKDDSSKEKQTFVGLINIGNNCYLNAGLQIRNYQEDKLMKLFVEAMVTLLFNKDKIYDPTEFIKCFCERNEDFTPGKPQCSQDFIRTILRNINETFEKNVMYEDYNPSEEEEKKMYESLILKNNIFPQTKAYSIFSGILKITITGICDNCGNEIKNYSFNNFVHLIKNVNSQKF